MGLPHRCLRPPPYTTSRLDSFTLEKLPPPVVSGATAVISGGSVEYGVASMDGFENPLSPEAFIAATVKSTCRHC